MDSAEFLLGTVTAVSQTNGIRIQLDGQDAAMSKYYKMLASGGNVPETGARVVVMKHSGTYIVMGKIGIPTQDSGKVSKTGDTMTGGLVMADSNVSIQDPVITLGTRPEANHWTKQFRILDSIGEAIAWIRAVAGANGLTGIQLYGRNIVSGTDQNNYLGLYMSDAGAATVEMNQPAAWRKALGLGSSGNLPITIGQGGTGQSAVSTTSVIANIATAATGFQIQLANYAVWGKVAMLRLTARATAAMSTNIWHSVAIIAEGKRPAQQIVMTDINQKRVSLDGSSLSVYGTIELNDTINFYATYLIA